MKKANKFRVGLAIFWLISLIGISAGLGWLWIRLEKYEAATPEAAVRHYLKQVEGQKWEEVLSWSDFAPTNLVTQEDYIAYLQQLYQDLPQEPTLVRTGEKAGSVYLLKDSEGKQIAKLELTDAPEGEKYAYRVQTQVTAEQSFVIEAPAGATVLVNGRPLPESALKERAPAQGYEELPEGYEAPVLLRYELNGLLQEPQVTVEGEDYQVRQIQKDKETIYEVTGVPAKEQEQEYLDLAQKVAKTYAAFVTQDADRTQLNAYLLPGTSFYKAMQQFYNSWYVEHTGYDYRNMECTELESAGENAFSVRVTFDYVVLRGSKEYSYPSDYRLFFLKTDAGWKLTRLDTL